MNSARDNLIGSGDRIWIKERVMIEMSTAGHCKGGETYQFHGNGTVDIRTCIDRVLRTRQARWQLVSEPPLDVALLFEGHRYELSFSGVGAPKMRWRVPSGTKIDPQTDIYLSLSKD